MKQKQDIMTAWNDAEECHHDFDSMSDSELIFCRNDIQLKLSNIMKALDPHFTEDDLAEAGII